MPFLFLNGGFYISVVVTGHTNSPKATVVPGSLKVALSIMSNKVTRPLMGQRNREKARKDMESIQPAHSDILIYPPQNASDSYVSNSDFRCRIGLAYRCAGFEKSVKSVNSHTNS